MKKILCVCVILLLCFTLYLNIKPLYINIDDELSRCIEIADSLVSIYEIKYSEEDIGKMADKFKDSDVVYDSFYQLYSELLDDEYVSLDYILSVSNISTIRDGEYDTNLIKDISVYNVDGIICVKTSDLINSNIFTYNGLDYMINQKDILTYENILDSLDFSYVFETAFVEENCIYCEYKSKGNQAPLTVVFEFDVFDKLSEISVVK